MALKGKSFFDRRESQPITTHTYKGGTAKKKNTVGSAMEWVGSGHKLKKKKKTQGTYMKVMSPPKKKKKKTYTNVPTPTLRAKPRSEMSTKAKKTYDSIMRDQEAALKIHAKKWPNSSVAKQYKKKQLQKKTQ